MARAIVLEPLKSPFYRQQTFQVEKCFFSSSTWLPLSGGWGLFPRTGANWPPVSYVCSTAWRAVRHRWLAKQSGVAACIVSVSPAVDCQMQPAATTDGPHPPDDSPRLPVTCCCPET
jgi:hypothetical protein